MDHTTKRPLDENNFYLDDSVSENHIFLANTGLPWRGGQAHYGMIDGTVQGWGLSPPQCLQMATPKQASEWSKKWAIKDYKKKIIRHLDEIIRLRAILKEFEEKK